MNLPRALKKRGNDPPKADHSEGAQRAEGSFLGFTIPELLLVIAAAILLFAFMLPVAMRFYRQQVVDDTSRTLIDTLKRARAQAIAQRNDAAHGVRVITASSTFVLFQGNSFATRVTSEDEIIEYPSSLTITATTTEVVFSRLYGTSTIDETWTVGLGSIQSQIRINSQGLIEIE